jgi:hypothetical protein
VIGTPIRFLVNVCYVAVVAAGDIRYVRYVVYISKRMRLDVVLLPRHVGHVGDVGDVVGVGLDVVLLPRHVGHVGDVGDVVGVGLDLYLFVGSLAILILHSLLLSDGIPINVHKTG